MTISDMDRQRYRGLRSHGVSHEDAILMWPEQHRESLKKNLAMSEWESHFGPWWHMLITIGVIGIGIGLYFLLR